MELKRKSTTSNSNVCLHFEMQGKKNSSEVGGAYICMFYL